jgi:hypothetical protein
MARRLRPASLHCHARRSVLVPVNVFGLPPEIDVLGERWAVKDEFHVTAAHAPHLAQRTGRPVEDVWAEVVAAVEGRRAGPVRVSDELRLARDGDERTIVVMARVDGLADLYVELSGRLGAPLAPPPAHITLYTRPGGEGIGLHDETGLREQTQVLARREADAVRAAIGFDAALGA